MLTIVFYGRSGAKAKARAKEIVSSKSGRAVVYDVTAWDGGKDGADAYEIVGDISYFDRQRIEHIFGVSASVKNIEPGTVSFEQAAEENLAAVEDVLVEKKKRGRKPKAVEAV